MTRNTWDNVVAYAFPPESSNLNSAKIMPETPLVSIIVRSVGRPQLLEALASVAGQTYPNVEIVVVDAIAVGHPGLGDRCGPYPLRIVGRDRPLARAAAANCGLDAARGDLIGFLDDDDLLESNHILKLVTAIQGAPDRRAVYSGVRVVDRGGATIRVFDDEFDPVRLRGANYIPIHAVLFDRGLLQDGARFDENLDCLEDWDFWLQIASRTRLHHVPGTSAIYRYDLGTSGLSRESLGDKHLSNREQLFRKWSDRFTPRDWIETFFKFETDRDHFQRLFQEREHDVSVLGAKVAELQERTARLERDVAHHAAEKVSAEAGRAAAEAEARRYRDWVGALLSSTSWKVTGPLRGAVRLVSFLTDSKRRAARWAAVRARLVKAWWYFRRHGSRATLRRIIGEIRALRRRTGRLGSLPGTAAEIVDLREIKPLMRDVAGRIAVHVHAFYPDLASEVATALESIPYRFDLYVSVPRAAGAETCRKHFSRLSRVDALVIDVLENRGRDIAPMTGHFGLRLSEYDYVCHLHTKKSSYSEGRMDGWREYLYRQLLGDENHVRRIFSLFEANPPVGIVYPQTYEQFPYWGNTWLSNRAIGHDLCRRLGIREIPDGYFDYPVGSMFWARGPALLPLLSAGLTAADFPPEAGQTDGTLAHAVERVLVLVVREAGFRPLILRDPHHPSWSKWRLDRYLDRVEEDVVAAIDSAAVRVVAFDIFDTLVSRPLLHPEAAKLIVARRLGADGEQFPELRAQAEGIARDRAGRDVSLEEIYPVLETLIGYPHEAMAAARALEESVETGLASPRPHGVRLYDHARAIGKRVVLVSDMFLPRPVVEALLAKCGITGYDALYLSSDVGVRKDSGALYRHLLDRERIAATELLMIGDNEHSDVQVPVDLGIRSCHLMRPVDLARMTLRFPRLLDRARAQAGVDDQLILGLVVRRFFEPAFFQRFDPLDFIHGGGESAGYAVVGPSALAFCLWTIEEARNRGSDRLYFLAREGELLKEVYDRVAEHGVSVVPAEYLVVSRRAVTVSMIDSFDDIERIARTEYFPNDLRSFLRYRFGVALTDAEFEALCADGLWERSRKVRIPGDERRLRPVLERLSERIMEQARSERPGLLDYLRERGLDSARAPAVVDVGYSGTIQAMLCRLLGRPVNGYYMMTSARSAEVCEQHDVFAQGFYAHRVAGNMPGTSALWRRSFELEMLFSSDDPQIVAYHKTAEGRVQGIHQELSLHEENAVRLRRQIRRGVAAFVDDFFRLKRDVYPDLRLSPALVENLFEEFVERMSASEREMMSSLALDDHYCGRGIVRLGE